MTDNRNFESSTGILVDWGTTNLRAYLVNEAGDVLETRNRSQGIQNVCNGEFADTINNILSGWDTTHPVLMSGMIGSAQGWHEAPYLKCPSSAEDIALGVIEIPDHPRYSIVAGASYQAQNGAFDVMRGEEVQIFGALDIMNQKSATLCLPGTHSKWASVKDGVLESFSTCITGEMYSVLKSHSILGALMTEGDCNETAFIKGLERSAAEGGVLHHLFSTRTEGLFKQIPPDGLPSYMSGILIGHELRNFAPDQPSENPVLLVSEGVLGQIYMDAFAFFEIPVQLVAAKDATVRGLNRLQKIAAMKGKK